MDEESDPFESHFRDRVIARKYRLGEVRSSSPHSLVFRAQHLFCGQAIRPVAVKIPRLAGLTEETAPLLFQGAAAVANVLSSTSHEGRRHLPQVLDLGLLPKRGGVAYLVLEWLEGQPLRAHFQATHSLPASDVARYFGQACQAVACLHESGVVHRGVSPDNLLIGQRGGLHLLDYSRAGLTDAEPGIAPALGPREVAYLAPEALAGAASPASDVYSLGLVFYEALAGWGPHLTAPWQLQKGPNEVEENQALKAGLHFPPLADLNHEARNDYRWLAPVLHRCLEATPALRFRDASELARALRDARSGKQAPPPPVAASASLERSPAGEDESLELLFRDVRKLLAGKAFDQAIDLLEPHRPAEWSTLSLTGARALRALGQAYLGKGGLVQARECLEQLRTGQREQPVLARPDYAAALSDLARCYRSLGLDSLARQCQDEARQLL
jgi:serine/threonine protein kinase